MGEAAYQAADRRPIAARRLVVFQRLAALLGGAGVSANSISVLGAVVATAAGAALFATRYVPPPSARLFWLAAAGLVQLRLLANLLDGMVAVASGTASALGELYNELPDRISDSVILIGLGYSAGGIAILGWLAALVAMLTAYVRGLGKSAGLESDFCGPMAKPHRMFVVTVASLIVGLTPAAWQRWGHWTPAQVGLIIIIAGSILTAIRRVARIGRRLGNRT